MGVRLTHIVRRAGGKDSGPLGDPCMPIRGVQAGKLMKLLDLEPIKQSVPRSYKMRWRMAKYNLLSLPKYRANHAGQAGGRSILFYPEVPWESSVMYQMCLMLGYHMTGNPHAGFDAAVRWKDTTIDTPGAVLEETARSCQVINLRCNDISKEHVEEVFREVFGYGTLVDPRTYQGECVEKSNLNAMHNGRIVQCPIEQPDPGSVYQMLIDTQVSETKVMDHRVPYFGGNIPCVLKWYKPLGKRFYVDPPARDCGSGRLLLPGRD